VENTTPGVSRKRRVYDEDDDYVPPNHHLRSLTKKSEVAGLRPGTRSRKRLVFAGEPVISRGNGGEVLSTTLRAASEDVSGRELVEAAVDGSQEGD
jgi:hypothetical protein